jgi:hypothetical protein
MAIPPEELKVALEARRELGEELEPQVIESFLERIEEAIDARVDERLANARPSKRHRMEAEHQLGVTLGSIGIGIPLTGIAAGTAGLAGLVVCWLGIVLVNFAYVLSRRR